MNRVGWRLARTTALTLLWSTGFAALPGSARAAEQAPAAAPQAVDRGDYDVPRPTGKKVR